MKLYNYIEKTIWVLPLLVMAACSDFEDYSDRISDIDSEGINLEVSVPTYKLTSLGTRADKDWINNLTVAYYKNDNRNDASNSFIKTIEINSYNVVNNQIRLVVPKVEDAKYIQLFVNCDLGNSNDASKVFISHHYLDNDENKSIFWGKGEINYNTNRIEGMALIHHNAKVSVKSQVNNFVLESYGVSNTRKSGALAPKEWNASFTEPNLQESGFQYSDLQESNLTTPTTQTPSPEIYIFETEAGKGKIIIKGKYNGSSTSSYYVVGFNNREKASNGNYQENPGDFIYNSIPLIRGHHYQLTIDYVRAEGWPSFEEALKAEPDNRMTVLIKDVNENIVDIIACRDYALGVNQPAIIPSVSKDNSPLETTLYIVTSYEGTNPISIMDGNNASMVSYNISDLDKVEEDDDDSYLAKDEISSGTLYKIKVTAKNPNKIQKELTCELIVRSGDLERTVTIRQAAYDLYRAGDREVYFMSNNSSIGTTYQPYFTWLDACKGVTAEANRGVARNEGLHFPPVNCYTITYRIPKQAGDSNPSVSSGFSLNNNDSQYYYLSSTADNNMSTGIFQFTNSDGQTLQYTLYKTGIFHQITDKILENATSEAPVEKGWYYYELVKANDVYILDRNLGATTNAAYKSTSSALRNNEGAKGAYFKIATQRFPNQSSSGLQSVESNVTIESNLSLPTGFYIPKQAQIEGLGITATNQGVTGGSAIVATVSNVTGMVANKTIFFPHGGYYDDVNGTFNNTDNANVWTKNLHCYSQGFDSKLSKEFGFWYRFLNGYATTVGATQIRNIGQIRYVDGTEGTSTGAYRYMPIRLVYGTTGGSSSGGNNGDNNGGNTGGTTHYLYLQDQNDKSSDWRLHTWTGSGSHSSWPNNVDQAKLSYYGTTGPSGVSGDDKNKGTWYRIEIPSGYENAKFKVHSLSNGSTVNYESGEYEFTNSDIYIGYYNNTGGNGFFKY